MKLLIGLGNPDAHYAHTRHNVGFWALDAYAKAHDLTFAKQSKFHAAIASFQRQGEKVLLVKPITYYNETGQAARSVMDYYQISPHDVLVLHDDLALPLGTIRTRVGGSDGGNNGLKSLAAHIGLDTARIRVGVWHEDHHTMNKASVVLGKFNADERAALDAQLPKLMEQIDAFVSGDFEQTTHRVDG